MPSSVKTVETNPEAVVNEPGRKPRAIPRRALLTLGALTAAVNADAQVRTPKRSKPTRALRPELKLLRRTTMGVTAEDISWINSLGYTGYLEWQLNANAMGDPDCETRLNQFVTIYLPPDQLYAQPDSQVVTRNITEAAICRAVYTNRQLLERMVEFWSDHFNTNITSVGVLKTPEVRNVYLQHGLGTFPAILNASAASPAMLVYLNNTQSDGRRLNTNPPTWRTPNQNYARELLELHTLGVDGGYTQNDVMEVARCFTGWRTTTSNSVVSAGAGPGTFYYDAARHDDRSKLVLGNTIAAGGGINDGLAVLNIVANHPSTARFIAKKMLRWLLTYDPSPALITDIAGEYSRTGGDIKSMIRRILSYDNVAAAPPLFKRPFHYIVSAIRAVNANVTSYATVRGTYLNGTGNIPYAWGPPDGYPQEFDYWAGLPLPRWNFAFQLANNSVSGVVVDVPGLMVGATSAIQVADRIDDLIFAGEMPDADKMALISYLRPGGSATAPSTSQVRDALGLAIASPAFQWH
jgi:uncharacterized protein (DUF1800 family)